jgi:hypothetical protein
VPPTAASITWPSKAGQMPPSAVHVSPCRAASKGGRSSWSPPVGGAKQQTTPVLLMTPASLMHPLTSVSLERRNARYVFRSGEAWAALLWKPTMVSSLREEDSSAPGVHSSGPVAATVNCHGSRVSKCPSSGEAEIIYLAQLSPSIYTHATWNRTCGDKAIPVPLH